MRLWEYRRKEIEMTILIVVLVTLLTTIASPLLVKVAVNFGIWWLESWKDIIDGFRNE
jgi:hypothetical protein